MIKQFLVLTCPIRDFTSFLVLVESNDTLAKHEKRKMSFNNAIQIGAWCATLVSRSQIVPCHV